MKGTIIILLLVTIGCVTAQPAEDIALSKIVDVSAPVHCVGPVKVYKTCTFEGTAVLPTALNVKSDDVALISNAALYANTCIS